MGNADCRGEVREGTKTGQEFGEGGDRPVGYLDCEWAKGPSR